jgi:tRNA(Ile2) C34 agmatinyltransferase TiaS
VQRLEPDPDGSRDGFRRRALEERVPEVQGGGVSGVLASERGLAVFLALLFGSGAMCPKCGFGTRVTSKRWARCKKCGGRVERRPMEEVAEKLKGAKDV